MMLAISVIWVSSSLSVSSSVSSIKASESMPSRVSASAPVTVKAPPEIVRPVPVMSVMATSPPTRRAVTMVEAPTSKDPSTKRSSSLATAALTAVPESLITL